MRQDRNASEREFQTRRLAKVETQRRKLLDAYYAGAVDVATLRSEQERIGREAHEVEELLRGVDATLAEWQEVLSMAMRFATSCAAAYRAANHQTRKLYNAAVFDQLIVTGGALAEARYQTPFELIFGSPEFEQGGMERETGVSRGRAAATNGVRVAYRLTSQST